MSVTKYAPDAHYTAGNTVIGDAPAVANIQAPKLSELAASITFEGATEAFGSTTNVTKGTRKMIADKIGKQRVQNREYQAENLVVMTGDPQAANALVEGFVPDSTHYFWIRPGLPDDTALAVGQKVQLIEATIDACDLRQVSTADGDEFAVTVSISIQDRTQLLVAIVASA